MISITKKVTASICIAVLIIAAPAAAMQLNPKSGQQLYKERAYYNKKQARKKLLVIVQTVYDDDTEIRNTAYKSLDRLYSDGKHHRDQEIEDLLSQVVEEKQDHN